MLPNGVQLVGKKMVLTPTEYRNEKIGSYRDVKNSKLHSFDS